MRIRALRHVGRAAQHRLVAGDQDTVLGHDEIRLDEVRPHADGHRIGFEGMFREIAAGSAMGDDQGGLTGQRLLLRDRRTGHQRKAECRSSQYCQIIHGHSSCTASLSVLL
jgi:hypothetical protein